MKRMKRQLGIHFYVTNLPVHVRVLQYIRHRMEFRDTSGAFSITCSAKFEIAQVKRHKTIKKIAENGATSTAPCFISFYTGH